MSAVKYRTIVADPPWAYPEGFASGHCTLNGARTPVHVAECPYPTMTAGEIATLPVAQFADRDCRLFMWTTNRYLPDSFGILHEWGFSYRQTLVWHKTDVNLPGHIAPNSAEFIVVAVCGGPARIGVMPSAVVATTRLGGSSAAVKSHSQKRECWLDYFEQVSPGPYLELFARRNRLGWDTWGNEALCHVGMEMTP